MSFYFEAQGAIHDEGTKYYQVIKIGIHGSTRGVVVTHWGKMHPGAPAEPKNHGQNKIECLASKTDSKFNSAIATKRKRGYGEWKVNASRRDLSDAEIQSQIDHWFNRSDAATIIKHLVGDDVEDVETGDPDYELGPDEPETTAAPEVEVPKHEEWGSW